MYNIQVGQPGTLGTSLQEKDAGFFDKLKLLRSTFADTRATEGLWSALKEAPSEWGRFGRAEVGQAKAQATRAAAKAKREAEAAAAAGAGAKAPAVATPEAPATTPAAAPTEEAAKAGAKPGNWNKWLWGGGGAAAGWLGHDMLSSPRSPQQYYGPPPDQQTY